MRTHLIIYNLLFINQHGFVKGKSYATNLIETIGIISEALNTCFSASAIFFDFLKASEREFTVSFLTNRKHRLVYGDHELDWAKVLSRVPQGSVLGLLLSLVLIYDYPGLVTHFCMLFADDTVVVTSVFGML